MTKTVIAKPIVDNQYWILTDGRDKIGNVIAEGGRYEVKLHGDTRYYNDLGEIVADVPIQWESNNKTQKSSTSLQIDWPIVGRAHNVILDIKRKLQLYTKSVESKCYYAAGYYNVNMNDQWETVLCPKYIYIQRYEWNGPYHTLEEARQYVNTDKYNNDQYQKIHR